MNDMASAGGLLRRQIATDDFEMLDQLLKKLIDSKKISRKQLIQKLMSVTDREEVNEDGEVRRARHRCFQRTQIVFYRIRTRLKTFLTARAKKKLRS